MKSFIRKMTMLILVILFILLAVNPVAAAEESNPLNEAEDYGSRDETNIHIVEGENIIISRGNYTVENFRVDSGATLTIGKGVNITVNKVIKNEGTLNVFGTLSLNSMTTFTGTVNVVKCTGKINGRVGALGKVVSSNHAYVDGICTLCGVKGCEIGELEHTWNEGVCSFCGKICSHEWDSNTGKCTICEYQCQHDGNTCVVCGQDLHSKGSAFVGSVFSGGSIGIVTAIAGVIIGMAVMFFIMKNKKPVSVKAAEEEIKDEE